MFIELTDHLRCPADHEEQFLVLLPDAMDGRMVAAGSLGCPVCGRTYRISGGVATLAADASPAPPSAPTGFSADALAAFLGLNGPGGYCVLAGAPAALWRELLEVVPGVAPVLVNPPEALAMEYPASVIRSNRIPLKTRSMRGVVLGAEEAGSAFWRAEAARVVLPGLRVVGEGGAPRREHGLELLASAEAAWVAAART